MPATGAVAQLGERRVRNAKAVGSIPIRSTNKSRTYAASEIHGRRFCCNGAVIVKENGLK